MEFISFINTILRSLFDESQRKGPFTIEQCNGLKPSFYQSHKQPFEAVFRHRNS